MISDVLSVAVQEIESIQQQMPGIYDAWAGEIDRVKESMVRLRIKLDTLHELTPETWIEGMIERISQEPEFHLQLNPLTYRIERSNVVRELGEGHPLVLRLAVAESSAKGGVTGPPQTD